MRRAVALALPLVCGACQPQSLQGSLTTVLDLSYTHSDLAIANGQAALRFLRPVPAEEVRPDAGATSGEDLVLKVVVNLQNQPVVPHFVFDLSQTLPNGTQVGELTRNVLNESPPTFPTIDRGQFYVRNAPVSGQFVSGYFSITFSEGIEAASGRTVYSSFSAKVL